MALLEARSITKIFPGVIALQDVNLSLEEGKIHCIVGENGAGKSTLVKVLTGLYQADEGSLMIGGEAMNSHTLHDSEMIAYVPQELNLFRFMSVAENLFIPFNKTKHSSVFYEKKKMEEEAAPYLKRFNMAVNPNDIVQDIPISEQQLLQVARALSREKFKIIILDEPTTSLTKSETDRLFTILKSLRDEGKAIVFISHKLDEVFSIGDHVSVLRNGELVGDSELSDVDQNWIIHRMTGAEIDITKNYVPSEPVGEVLLDVKNLSGYMFDDVSFILRKGEILGFAGLIGAGRSEIMQTIYGYRKKKSGEVTYNGHKWKFGDTTYSIENGVVYLTEERKTHGILPFQNVRENIGIVLRNKISRKGIVIPRQEHSISKKIIKNYSVKTSSTETKIVNLSGGNQQKVLIGRAMESSPKVVIFDEPTKGIDVKTKEEIYRMMKELAEKERVGIILISSEMEELLKCSNRIVTMYNGRISSEIIGEKITQNQILRAIIGLSCGTNGSEN
jgi:ribose transport system ATP-binding protein